MRDLDFDLDLDLDFETLLVEQLLDLFKRERDLEFVLDRETESDRDLLILLRGRELLRVRDRLEWLLVLDLAYFRGLERALRDLARQNIVRSMKQLFNSIELSSLASLAIYLILDLLRFLSRVLYDLVLLTEREQLLDLDFDSFLLTVLSLKAGLSDRRRLK